MHSHAVHGVAVSAQQEGLLPISQQALVVLTSLGYHDYEGIALSEEEKPRLVADLGGHRHLMLRNHGLLTAAPTIPDAFLAMYTLVAACTIQVRAQSSAQPLRLVPEAIRARIAEQATAVTGGLGGQLAWPGLLRRLRRDTPGFDA
jgi:ribulose-5-phosphate 4-epimerase/fuculose-1-phosphate aldolase